MKDKQECYQSKLKACHLYYAPFKYNAVLIRECNALKNKGFDVDIICLRSNAKDKIIQTMYGLKLYCIQSRASKEKKSILYFFHLGLFFFKATLLLSFLGIFKRYDLIHVTSPPDIIVFTAVIPKLMGAKIILDIHDIGPELYMRKLGVPENRKIIKLMKYLERISCRFVDHVITVTDIWRKKLISRSVPSSKCSVLLNVPDEYIFVPSPSRKPKDSNTFNLYYHGTIDEHFGVDTLIEAMPKIKLNIPNVMLYIYGKGRIRQELETLTKKLNMNDSVRFHDPVPFYTLPEILAHADIGIVPTKKSVFADDLLAMKSLEYISLGIPIVISKTTGHSYYYNDSMVKFFEPENERELAIAVIALYKNEEERKRLIENSQKFIQNNSWAIIKNVYLEVIDRLLS